MLRSIGIGGNVGQVDLGLQHAGEFDLGLFGSFAQALEGLAVLAQVNALFLLKLIGGPVYNALVPVIAAQVGITVGGFDLDDALTNIQDRNIEGTTAQVKDQDGFVLFLIQTVGQGGGSGLIDDALDVQAGNFAGILGGLALAVIKISRDSDHRFGNRLAKVGFSIAFKLCQDHGGDFLRAIITPGDRHFDTRLILGTGFNGIWHHLALSLHLFKAAAHKTLDGGNGIFRVDDGLALGGLTDHALIVLAKCHYGWAQAPAFCGGDDSRLAAFHNGYDTIRGSEVNSDDFSHDKSPLVI